MKSWFKQKIVDKLNAYKSFFQFVSFLKKQVNTSGIFFFFPYYHVGGAERVHIDIVKSVAQTKPWIFFTTTSDNDAFLNEFSALGRVFFLFSFDKKKFRKRVMNQIANNVNRHPHPVVFSCNSLYFYELLPLLKEHVKCIDLIHAFNHKHERGAEHWSLPYVAKLNKRVFISHKAIRDLKHFYEEHNVDIKLLERVVFIGNKVTTSPEIIYKNETPLKLIYVGRGSEEKRVYLIGMIAEKCNDLNLPVQFISVGNNEKSFKQEHRGHIRFEGEINNQDEITELYKEAHAILITSSREGFPMAIMEGMAWGAFAISTAVGDIPFHVKNLENGFTIEANQSEEAIVDDFVKCISNICSNEINRQVISENAWHYAQKMFSEEEFNKSYVALLTPSSL